MKLTPEMLEILESVGNAQAFTDIPCELSPTGTTYTDFKAVYISGNSPPWGRGPEDFWISKKMKRDHEYAHLLFTSETAWKDFCHATRDYPLAKDVLNILEDARVERAWGLEYPGTVKSFAYVNIQSAAQSLNNGPVKGVRALLSGILIYAQTGIVDHRLKGKEKDALEKAIPHIDAARLAATTEEAVPSADKVTQILRDIFPEEDAAQEIVSDPGLNPKPGKAKSGDNDNYRRPPPKPEKPRKSSSEKSKEPEDGPSGGGSSEEPDEASEKPQDNPSGGASEEPGEATDEASEEPEDSSSGDGASEEPGDASSDEALEEPEDSSSGDGASEEPGDATDEASQESGGKASSGEASSKSGKPGDASSDEATEKPGGGDPPPVKPGDLVENFKKLAKDLKASAKVELEDIKKKQDARQRETQNPHSGIKVLEFSESTKKACPSLNKYAAQHLPTAKRLAQSIREVLLKKSNAPLKNLKKGRPDPARLWRLPAVGDVAVFRKSMRETSKTDTAVLILADRSGSMCNEDNSDAARINYAADALYIASTAMTLSGCIDHAVMSFTTRADKVSHMWHKKFGMAEKLSLMSYYPSEENRDGLSIRWATQALAARPERQKLLIIISDGLPSHISNSMHPKRKYSGPPAYEDVAAAVREAERRKITIISIYCGGPEQAAGHKAMYPHWIASDSKKLPQTLPAVIKRALKT